MLHHVNDDDEVEQFYENTRAKHQTLRKVVMDDLNAKLGCVAKAEERYNGRCGTGEQNGKDDDDEIQQ